MYSLRPKAVDFDKTWHLLEISMLDIITLQPISKVDWNDRFSDIYQICVAIPDPLSEKLYQSVKDSLERHTNRLQLELSQVPSEELLSEYFKLWTVFYEGTRYVHNLFRYLNRQFVKNKRAQECDGFSSFHAFIVPNDVKEIGSLLLDTWRNQVLKPLLPSLTNLILSAIADDREGKPINNQKIVHGVILSFVQVEESFYSEDIKQPTISTEFYKAEFEKKFLDATREFYARLSSQLFEHETCSSYMKIIIEKLEEEEKRTKSYVPASTLPLAMRRCQEVMIDAHKDKFYAVCNELIENEKKEDLHNMYRLLKPVPNGTHHLVVEFEKYVKKKGLEAIETLGASGESLPIQFVDAILSVHGKYSAIKDEVFMNDGDFSGALDKALQTVVNIRDNESPRQMPRAAERLARYSDLLLRKSVKGQTESEMETALSKAIVIFRYIEDKDMFQKFYSKMLANRLIAGTSVSMDAEESMITKLKQACGYEFTSKLSRMFMDIGLSKDIGDKFQSYVDAEKLTLNTTMNPLVLQAGAWPLQIPVGSSSNEESSQQVFAIPTVLEPSVRAFQEFYTKAHNGRKLTWLFHLSTCDVKLGYLDKPYTLMMSVHQLAILFHFQNVDSVTYQVLEEGTRLRGELFAKNLKTLIDAFVLEDPNADASPADRKITLHKNPKWKRLRFKVPQPSMAKQAEKESESVSNTVIQDRKLYMECAIVRIMKTRKVLKHTALVQEVIEHTKARFVPDVSFIKKSIEDLIEKMYLQRTDHHDEYQYLA